MKCYHLLSLGLLLTACQSTGPLSSPAAAVMPASLRNTRWELRQLGPEPVRAAPDAAAPYLLLSAEQPRVEGQAGCNRFGGSYEQPTPEQLRFGRLLATKMACPALATETRYLQALAQVSYYRIVGDTLRLYPGPPAETQPLARFLAVGAP
jgi:heat shock protein HslJ